MKYFFDTNIIIDIFNEKDDAIKKLEEILIKENSEIFINRLVYLEALRTIRFKNKKIFRKAKTILDSFEKLDITQEVYDKAVNFSRYCHSKGVKLKGECEAIDFLHFITAKEYNLMMISNDKDLEKLEEQYRELPLAKE
ncbi:MAG TPA: PIN domain-containing protein, partial [Campylobacterales bacterium]|nr:PIN domain-containing protein [Campylobacterales bacterium]